MATTDYKAVFYLHLGKLCGRDSRDTGGAKTSRATQGKTAETSNEADGKGTGGVGW